MGRYHAEMMRKFGAIVTSLALAGLTCAASAGADDYMFEAVKPNIKTSNVATISVRLVHKPTGKAVPNADIVETRLTMPHEGAAEMTSAIAPRPSPQPGVYAFMAPMTMAGRWLLSLTAKVEGEPGMVIGTVAFQASQ
jgi:hypothetical protein